MRFLSIQPGVFFFDINYWIVNGGEHLRVKLVAVAFDISFLLWIYIRKKLSKA